jgi:magnesium-transporting ATPase (P-type)
LLMNVVSGEMASIGLKPLSYAYKSFPKYELEQLMEKCNVESDDFLNELLCDLVYLGTFGLKDEMREDVAESIRLIRHGNKDVDILNAK